VKKPAPAMPQIFFGGAVVLALESWHEGNSIASVWSLVVGEGRMRPVHWLVFHLMFSTLMVGCWEGPPAHKNPFCQSPEVLLWDSLRKRISWGTDTGSPVKI